VILAAIAFVAEFIDSSLGMGYGTTLTPILLMLGYEPLVVVPAVLCSELATGLLAAALHHRAGNVRFVGRELGVAGMLCGLSVVGAVAAVSVAVSIPGVWLKVWIAAVVICMGVLTLFRRREYRFSWGRLAAFGALAAFNKGLSGGGYGPLVTGGQLMAGNGVRSSIGVTSLAEGVTCAVGLGAFLLAGGRLDLRLAVPLFIGALLSVPLAVFIVRRVHEVAERRLVGLAMLALGILMVARL